MWPFNLFRRKNKSLNVLPLKENSLREALDKVAELIPDRYKNEQQFINFLQFIEHEDWSHALESLVGLADKSGHFFSDAFWMNLSNCARGISMLSLADYCSQQILRNKSELGHSIPDGYIIEKVGDTMFNSYISEKIKNDWVAERREKDKLNRFITSNGFHLKSQGRCGTIYYIEDGKVLEIDYEISGTKKYDLLIFYDSVSNWALPIQAKLSDSQKSEIRSGLVEWLKLKKIRAEL